MRSPRIPVMRAMVLPPYVKFQSGRLSLSEVMAGFRFTALSGLLSFTFDLLTFKMSCAMSPATGKTFLPILLCDWSLSSCGQTLVTRTAWRHNHELSSLSSTRMSMMRIVALRPCTKFEVRWPSLSVDTADFMSRHQSA